MPIFNSTHDFRRFLKTMQYYTIEDPKPKLSSFASSAFLISPNSKIISLNTYCLMPNHFHFLVQQVRDGGITEFISKLSNSYTKYFNVKYGRVGPLLQGEFQSVHVESNEQLLHLNRYIHLNPTVNFISKTLDDYLWSSYHEYVNEISVEICDKKIILDQFPSREAYKQFVLDQEDYGKVLESIKHQLLDFEE